MEDNPIIYEIIVLDKAKNNLDAKYAYICETLRSPDVAYHWFTRLRRDISNNLSTFPHKYREYVPGKRIFISKTDIVLYSVDDAAGIVYIESVHTRGKDLSNLIN